MLIVVQWTTSATILVATFGYGDQIRLIIQNQSTDGLSFVVVLLAFFLGLITHSTAGSTKTRRFLGQTLYGTVLISIIMLSLAIF